MDRIQKTKKFAKESLKNKDLVHGVEHAKNTSYFANILAKKEKGNFKLCIIAAWLHDIGRLDKGKGWVKETIKKNHGTVGAKKAKTFLKSLRLKTNEVNEICKAISCHCFPNIQKDLTSKILWDADKLNIFYPKTNIKYIKSCMNKGMSKEKAKKHVEKDKKSYMKTFHFNSTRELIKKWDTK